MSGDFNQVPQVPQVPISDLRGLFDMLNRACGELSGVKNQLSDFNTIPVHLQNLCDGQKRMESSISDLKADHKAAVEDMRTHKEDIIKLQGTVDSIVKDAKELEESVEKLRTVINGIVIKIAAIAGGVSVVIWLVTQAIAVYDKLPHSSGKVGTITPPVLTRGRG